MFDQFPGTHHLEIGMYLRRREGLPEVEESSVDIKLEEWSQNVKLIAGKIV